jgi:hypothetical protein
MYCLHVLLGTVLQHMAWEAQHNPMYAVEVAHVPALTHTALCVLLCTAALSVGAQSWCCLMQTTMRWVECDTGW